MSRRSRSAVKLVAGTPRSSRCWMFSAPTEYAPCAAGQARAAQDRDRLAGSDKADPPAEEEAHVLRSGSAARRRVAAAATLAADIAELEDALVLEEEIALLGEEQVEPREVDLLLVGFDLREVGVDGEVPARARS